MKKKNRVKARQDIGCEFGLRPNLLLTSLPPSFVLSFRARSLTFLPTLGNSRFSDGNRNSIVYPRFMKKKLPARLSAISPENPKYITCFVVLDFPSVALRAHFSPPLPKLRYPRAILYCRVEFFEARRRDHREIGNSGRRRVKKASTRKEAKEERKVTSVGRRGTFVAEWKRVEGGESCSLPLARVEDFLPSPPSDPIDDIRESAHVSSITATS